MMQENGDKSVTPAVVQAHQEELEKCLVEVDQRAKKAKEAAGQAQATAAKCRQIEEETKRMISQFNESQGN